MPSAAGRARSGARSPGVSCDTVAVSHCISGAARRPSPVWRPGAALCRGDLPAVVTRSTRSPLCTCPTDSWTSHLDRDGGGRRRCRPASRCGGPGRSSPSRPRRWRGSCRRSCSRCRCSTSPSGSGPPGTSWAGRWPRCSSARGPRSSASRWSSPPGAAVRRRRGVRAGLQRVAHRRGHRRRRLRGGQGRDGGPAQAAVRRARRRASARWCRCRPPRSSSSGSTPSAGRPSFDSAQLSIMVTSHILIGMGEAIITGLRWARWWRPAPTWSGWPGATGLVLTDADGRHEPRGRWRGPGPRVEGGARMGIGGVSGGAWSWPGSCPAGRAPTRTGWSPWPGGSASSGPRRIPSAGVQRSATTSRASTTPFGVAGVVGVAWPCASALLFAARPAAPPAARDDRPPRRSEVGAGHHPQRLRLFVFPATRRCTGCPPRSKSSGWWRSWSRSSRPEAAGVRGVRGLRAAAPRAVVSRGSGRDRPAAHGHRGPVPRLRGPAAVRRPRGAGGRARPLAVARRPARRLQHPRQGDPRRGRGHPAVGDDTPRDLVVGLQRLRVPGLFVTILSFMVRYLDVVVDEMRRMRWRGRPAASRPGTWATCPWWPRPPAPCSSAPTSGASASTWPCVARVTGTMPQLGPHPPRRGGGPSSRRRRLGVTGSRPPAWRRGLHPPSLELRGVAYAYPDGHGAVRGRPAGRPRRARRAARAERRGEDHAGAAPQRHPRGRVGHGSRGRAARRGSNLAEIRRRVGLVFQDPDDQLFMPTVRDDVAFGPANLGSTTPELAARVEPSARGGRDGRDADRPPHHL